MFALSELHTLVVKGRNTFIKGRVHIDNCNTDNKQLKHSNIRLVPSVLLPGIYFPTLCDHMGLLSKVAIDRLRVNDFILKIVVK